MRIIDQLSFSDKLRIVEEYRNNGGSLHELARKYGVSRTSIWHWNRIFAPVKRSSRMNTHKDLKSQENDVRIRELEAELERLRLLVEAKDIMLDIVKEQTGFDARKKAGAKQ
jgi:transposase-like protein